MSLARQRALHACASMPNSRRAHPTSAPFFHLLGLFALLMYAMPARADVIELRPAASKDDAEERADLSMYTGSSDLELTFDTSTQKIGIRWPGVLIPKGATITTAYVQFEAKESQTEQTDLLFAGQAADNAAAFGTAAGDISNRLRTTNTVAWPSVPAWTAGQTTSAQRSPELKNVIFEIVNRANWVSGNALVLLITGTGHRTATAWDHNPATAPLLHIEFTTGGPPVDNAPAAVLNVSQDASPNYTVTADATGSSDSDATPIASYTFNWGDGSSNTVVSAPTQTAKHTYAGASTYTVTLTATDTGNLTSTPVTKQITVNPPPPDNAPVAVLNVSQAASPALTVNASAAGSTDADVTPIASYTFNWGDGSANTIVTAPTQTASHTYAAANTYTVTLTATDTGNQTSTPVTKPITVSAVVDNPPAAVLTASVLSTPARTIQASGAGSTDTDATGIASYTFNWGDGTANTTVTAPAWSATHAYATANTYTVTLTVKDSGNLASVPVTKQVTVANPVTPSVTFNATPLVESDDAEESSTGSVSLTSADLELVYDGNNQVVGVRFPNLNVYTGATITSAYIQFTANESQSEATLLSIYAQAIANAPTFTTTSKGVSTRARTSGIDWAPDPWTAGQVLAIQRTPELKSIVQQVVSLGGWAPGNAMAFIITGTGHRTAEAWQNGKTALWPVLHVEFTGGTPPVDQAPVAVLNVTPTNLSVSASAAGSTDTDATPIASYTFNWGDGTANTVVNAPTQTASHTYASANTYTVTLTAKDTGNLTSTPVTKSVTVSSGGGATGLSVWASYYSTHHSYNPQPKPTPWMGSANVVFVGTPDSPSGGWDSGGIRIDNNTGSSQTMTVTCVIGSKTFNLWGSRTVPNGQSLILAQTGYENFDGSDTSPAGCYGCDPKLCLTAVVSTVPVINVTINGVTTKYYDTKQTINTNGVDYAGCPPTSGRNDESRGWVQIFTSTAATGPAATNMYEGDPNTEILGLSWMAPIFPNPVRGNTGALTLQFRVGLKGAAEISIYDVAGRLVRNELTHEFEPGQYQKMIPTQGLVSGMYYCTLRTKEGTLKQSFVVQE